MSLVQWISIASVLIVVLVFWYSLKLMFKESQKDLDTTKLDEWLNRVHPLPEHKDMSFLDKMKRKRKYKPKAVIKTYTKK